MRRKLRVEFQTKEAFVREYAQNISNGGIFIATRKTLEVRELVTVELVLSAWDETLQLPGEVVHSIPEELAETGAASGVAVQFLLDAPELRAQLERFGGSVSELDERAQGHGRRKAPRSRARVPVRVRVEDRWLEGRTRNISASGLLVVLPCAPLPIGEEVDLVVCHPTNDEEMEIGGLVARHVDVESGDDGLVSCIGIEFRVPDASVEEVADFARRIRAAEHNRRLGGINGPIADLGIERVLRMFGSTAQCGMLTLARGSEEGYVTIQDGTLNAQLGSLEGRAALDAMLAWRDGSFEFEARVDDGLVSGEAMPIDEVLGVDPPQGEDEDALELTDEVDDSANASGPDFGDEDLDLELDLDEFELGESDEGVSDEGDLGESEEVELDEGVDQVEFDVAVDEGELDVAVDEGEPDPDAGEAAPEEEDALAQLHQDFARISPDALLSVDLSAVDAERDHLDKLDEALIDLASVGMPVAKAIDVIPESEDEVYAALSSLVERGLLFLD